MKTIVIASLKSVVITTHAGKAKPVYALTLAEKPTDEQKKELRSHGVYTAHGHWYIGVKNEGVAWVQAHVKKPSKKAQPKAAPKKAAPKFSEAELKGKTKADLIALLLAK